MLTGEPRREARIASFCDCPVAPLAFAFIDHRTRPAIWARGLRCTHARWHLADVARNVRNLLRIREMSRVREVLHQGIDPRSTSKVGQLPRDHCKGLPRDGRDRSI